MGNTGEAGTGGSGGRAERFDVAIARARPLIDFPIESVAGAATLTALSLLALVLAAFVGAGAYAYFAWAAGDAWDTVRVTGPVAFGLVSSILFWPVLRAGCDALHSLRAGRVLTLTEAGLEIPARGVFLPWGGVRRMHLSAMWGVDAYTLLFVTGETSRGRRLHSAVFVANAAYPPERINALLQERLGRFGVAGGGVDAS